MAVDKNGKELPKGIALRADGRYMGRFTFKGESFTVYDKDLKKLKKKLSDLQYEVEHGVFAKEENITVESWFNTWIKEYKVNSVKRGTIVNYTNTFNSYILPFLGKKKIKDIRPEQIQSLYNSMISKGYSKRTILLINIVLSGMYKQAVKNKIVKENPVALATIPREKKKSERRVLSLKEQQLFLHYAENSKYYDFYQVALFTGLRCGELRALKWENIDFKNKTISVTGTLKNFKGQGFVKETPKTSTSERVIPMLEGVAKLLKKHKVEQMKLRLLMGGEWKPCINLDDLVFTRETGEPVAVSSIVGDIERIINRINKAEKETAAVENRNPVIFEHISPHTFRHSFATRGIEKGIAPKVMQEILGHSSLSMTMDLYAHVLPDTKANEIQKIANLF